MRIEVGEGRMVEVEIFSPAKPDGETWIEHSKNTYHVGRIMWNLVSSEISKFFSEDEFLWCCFFHDVGKLLKETSQDFHSPHTEDAIDNLKRTATYKQLLENFSLKDFSESEKLLRIMKEHHNNKIEGSEWITIADTISSSDFGAINELESTSLQPYVKFLISGIHKLSGFNLIKVELPKPAYSERVIFGQIYLRKVLREAVENICNEKDTFYLFDIEYGCKILTKLKYEDVRELIKESFKKHLLELFGAFNIAQLIGGQPQSAVRLRQYVFPERKDTVEESLKRLMLVEICGNIGRHAKIKDFPKTSELLEKSLSELYDVIKEYSGFIYEDFQKIYDHDFLSLGFHNKIKTALISSTNQILGESKNPKYSYLLPITKFVNHQKPDEIVLHTILLNSGIDIENKKYLECLYEPIAKFIVRRNNFKNPDYEKYPNLDVNSILNFVIFNNRIPLDNLASERNEICASCGTFRVTMGAGQIIVPFSKQQWRERIGKSDTEQPLCPFCYFSMLMCTYLTGTRKEGNNVRPLDSMFLVLEGISIKGNLENFLNEDIFKQQFIEKFNRITKSKIEIKKPIVYIPNIADFELIVLSITSTTDEFFHYPSMNEYAIYDFILSLIENVENLLSVSYNEQPKLVGKYRISTPNGEVDLREIGGHIKLFRFIKNVAPDIKSLISYFRMFSMFPAFTLSNLVKETQTKGKRKVYLSNEYFKEGLEMIPEDKNFALMKELWKIVGLLGQLPRGFGRYEVVKPIKLFKGTPESLDKTLNFLLKEVKASRENLDEAMKIFEELRDDLKKLDSKEQKILAEYARKTTFLFSKLAWIEKRGE